MRDEFTALILCGGRSSRMGRDKTLLPAGSGTFLSRAVAFWQPLCCAVLLASGSDSHFDETPGAVPQLPDRYPGCGPLAGLHAGLCAAQTPYLLISAVDMPFLTADAVLPLMQGVQGHDACVYLKDGRPEPLLGAYRCAGCLPVTESLLDAGQLRMAALLQKLDTVYLQTDTPEVFSNINTPDAYARFRQQLEVQA